MLFLMFANIHVGVVCTAGIIQSKDFLGLFRQQMLQRLLHSTYYILEVSPNFTKIKAS